MNSCVVLFPEHWMYKIIWMGWWTFNWSDAKGWPVSCRWNFTCRWQCSGKIEFSPWYVYVCVNHAGFLWNLVWRSFH